MTKELTGPYGQEITAKHEELADWQSVQAGIEAETNGAVATRDLASLAAVVARRNALPLIVKSIEAELVGLYEQRSAALAAQDQAHIDAANATMADKPRVETLTVDPNSRVTITRARF